MIKRLRKQKQKLQRSRRLTRRYRLRGGSLPIPVGAVAAVSLQEQGKVGDVDSVPRLISKNAYNSISI